MQKFFLAFMVGVFAVSFQTTPLGDRHPDAMSFPRLANTSDVDEVLNDYPAYLRFVLEVGKDKDKKTAERLDHVYSQLRQRDPNGAARFLRGLRFEILQKLELLGVSEESVSTSSPVIRRWIAKFLPTWYREADEYLFRAVTANVAKR